MIAATKDQAAMTTNILRIVLNHLTTEYSLSYLVRSDKVGRRVHGVESMWKIKDPLSRSLTNSFYK